MPTLNDITRETAALSSEKGWPDKSPEERFVYITGELGELAEALLKLQWASDVGERSRLADAVAEEMYDVIWNICDLARLLDIDLDTAAARKADSDRTRSWRPGTE